MDICLKSFGSVFFRFLGASFEGNHDKATVYFLSRAARAGDAWSQNNLGCCYLAGRGVEVDTKRAIELFVESAKSDQVEACLNLGQIYYEGKHVSRNDLQSFMWFAKAAECGDSRGEYRLGLMYYDGIGVERDFEKSLTLLTSAESKGVVVQKEIISFLTSHCGEYTKRRDGSI